MFCEKVTTGGIYRAKLHQVGGNRNVKKCMKCPDHVREELEQYMNGKKQEKINYDKIPDFDDLKNTIEIEEDVEEDEINLTRKRSKISVIDIGKGKNTVVINKSKQRGPMDSFISKKPEVVVELRKQGRLRQANINDSLDKDKRAMACQYISRFFY